MTRYLETLFRRRRLLTAPILLALAAGCLFVLTQPRSYQASASLWFESAAVAGDSSPTAAYLSPSDAAVGVFHELLNTHAFCAQVGRQGPLGSYLAANPGAAATDPLTAGSQLVHSALGPATPSSPSTVDDEVQSLLAKTVKVTSTGPQVVSITFDFRDPQVAVGTLEALLAQYHQTVVEAQRQTAQAQVSILETQVLDQEKRVKSADADVATYLAQHPDLRQPNPPPDATLAGLQQVADLMHQRYAALLQQLGQAKVTAAGGNVSDFRVIDAPGVPSRSSSLLRLVLAGIGGGLAGGLLVSLVLLVLLTLADDTVHNADDLTRLTGLDVVATAGLQRSAATRLRASGR